MSQALSASFQTSASSWHSNGTDMEAWARSLGIDPEAEPDLLAFMTKAFDHPLPAPWTEHADKKGRVFFWNQQSRQSSWQHPLAQSHRSLVGSYRRVMQATDRPAACAAEIEAFHAHGEEEISKWRQSHAPDGTPYYYKVGTQTTRWDNPRDELVGHMELRVRMLSELADPSLAGPDLRSQTPQAASLSHPMTPASQQNQDPEEDAHWLPPPERLAEDAAAPDGAGAGAAASGGGRGGGLPRPEPSPNGESASSSGSRPRRRQAQANTDPASPSASRNEGPSYTFGSEPASGSSGLIKAAEPAFSFEPTSSSSGVPKPEARARKPARGPPALPARPGHKTEGILRPPASGSEPASSSSGVLGAEARTLSRDTATSSRDASASPRPGKKKGGSPWNLGMRLASGIKKTLGIHDRRKPRSGEAEEAPAPEAQPAATKQDSLASAPVLRTSLRGSSLGSHSESSSSSAAAAAESKEALEALAPSDPRMPPSPIAEADAAVAIATMTTEGPAEPEPSAAAAAVHPEPPRGGEEEPAGLLAIFGSGDVQEPTVADDEVDESWEEAAAANGGDGAMEPQDHAELEAEPPAAEMVEGQPSASTRLLLGFLEEPVAAAADLGDGEAIATPISRSVTAVSAVSELQSAPEVNAVSEVRAVSEVAGSNLLSPTASLTASPGPSLRSPAGPVIPDELAVHLGMRLAEPADAAAFEILRPLFLKPLPAPWQVLRRPTGRKDFYHPGLGDVTRQHPMLPFFGELLEFLRCNMGKDEQSMNELLDAKIFDEVNPQMLRERAGIWEGPNIKPGAGPAEVYFQRIAPGAKSEGSGAEQGARRRDDPRLEAAAELTFRLSGWYHLWMSFVREAPFPLEEESIPELSTQLAENIVVAPGAHAKALRAQVAFAAAKADSTEHHQKPASEDAALGEVPTSAGEDKEGAEGPSSSEAESEERPSPEVAGAEVAKVEETPVEAQQPEAHPESVPPMDGKQDGQSHEVVEEAKAQVEEAPAEAEQPEAHQESVPPTEAAEEQQTPETVEEDKPKAEEAPSEAQPPPPEAEAHHEEEAVPPTAGVEQEQQLPEVVKEEESKAEEAPAEAQPPAGDPEPVLPTEGEQEDQAVAEATEPSQGDEAEVETPQPDAAPPQQESQREAEAVEAPAPEEGALEADGAGKEEQPAEAPAAREAAPEEEEEAAAAVEKTPRAGEEVHDEPSSLPEPELRQTQEDDQEVQAKGEGEEEPGQTAAPEPDAEGVQELAEVQPEEGPVSKAVEEPNFQQADAEAVQPAAGEEAVEPEEGLASPVLEEEENAPPAEAGKPQPVEVKPEEGVETNVEEATAAENEAEEEEEAGGPAAEVQQQQEGPIESLAAEESPKEDAEEEEYEGDEFEDEFEDEEEQEEKDEEEEEDDEKPAADQARDEAEAEEEDKAEEKEEERAKAQGAAEDVVAVDAAPVAAEEEEAAPDTELAGADPGEVVQPAQVESQEGEQSSSAGVDAQVAAPAEVPVPEHAVAAGVIAPNQAAEVPQASEAPAEQVAAAEQAPAPGAAVARNQPDQTDVVSASDAAGPGQEAGEAEEAPEEQEVPLEKEIVEHKDEKNVEEAMEEEKEPQEEEREEEVESFLPFLTKQTAAEWAEHCLRPLTPPSRASVGSPDTPGQPIRRPPSRRQKVGFNPEVWGGIGSRPSSAAARREAPAPGPISAVPEPPQAPGDAKSEESAADVLVVTDEAPEASNGGDDGADDGVAIEKVPSSELELVKASNAEEEQQPESAKPAPEDQEVLASQAVEPEPVEVADEEAAPVPIEDDAEAEDLAAGNTEVMAFTQSLRSSATFFDRCLNVPPPDEASLSEAPWRARTMKKEDVGALFPQRSRLKKPDMLSRKKSDVMDRPSALEEVDTVLEGRLARLSSPAHDSTPVPPYLAGAAEAPQQGALRPLDVRVRSLSPRLRGRSRQASEAAPPRGACARPDSAGPRARRPTGELLPPQPNAAAMEACKSVKRFLSRTCGTMQAALAIFDPSGDGVFTVEEFEGGLERLGYEATYDVREIFKALDRRTHHVLTLSDLIDRMEGLPVTEGVQEPGLHGTSSTILYEVMNAEINAIVSEAMGDILQQELLAPRGRATAMPDLDTWMEGREDALALQEFAAQARAPLSPNSASIREEDEADDDEDHFGSGDDVVRASSHGTPQQGGRSRGHRALQEDMMKRQAGARFNDAMKRSKTMPMKPRRQPASLKKYRPLGLLAKAAMTPEGSPTGTEASSKASGLKASDLGLDGDGPSDAEEHSRGERANSKGSVRSNTSLASLDLAISNVENLEAVESFSRTPEGSQVQNGEETSKGRRRQSTALLTKPPQLLPREVMQAIERHSARTNIGSPTMREISQASTPKFPEMRSPSEGKSASLGVPKTIQRRGSAILIDKIQQLQGQSESPSGRFPHFSIEESPEEETEEKPSRANHSTSRHQRSQTQRQRRPENRYPGFKFADKDLPSTAEPSTMQTEDSAKLMPWVRTPEDVCKTYGHIFRLLNDPQIKRLQGASKRSMNSKASMGGEDFAAASSSVAEGSGEATAAFFDAAMPAPPRFVKNSPISKSAPSIVTSSGAAAAAGSWQRSPQAAGSGFAAAEVGGCSLPPLQAAGLHMTASMRGSPSPLLKYGKQPSGIDAQARRSPPELLRAA